MLDINKLPKKLNEINYFKKEPFGCTLYSYSLKNDTTIVVELRDFEIDNDFCVESKVVDMLRVLSPITSIKVDNVFEIKSKKGKYKATLLDNQLKKPNMDFTKKFEVDFDRVLMASDFVDTKGTRVVLTGININSNGSINATDSYIAFRYINNDYKEQLEENLSIIVPKDFIGFVSKEFSGKVKFEFNEQTCQLRKDNVKYITRLISGTYPSLDNIYNAKNNSQELVFDYKDFVEKYEVAKQVGQNSDKINCLRFSNNKFVALGENEFESELTTNSNIAYDFALSQDKFDKVFSKISSANEKLKMNYTNPTRPLFFEDNGNEFLLLPIRVE